MAPLDDMAQGRIEGPGTPGAAPWWAIVPRGMGSSLNVPDFWIYQNDCVKFNYAPAFYGILFQNEGSIVVGEGLILSDLDTYGKDRILTYARCHVT